MNPLAVIAELILAAKAEDDHDTADLLADVAKDPDRAARLVKELTAA